MKRLPKRGRPPLPRGKRRSNIVKVRATDKELDKIDALAEKHGTDRSGLIRLAIDAMMTRSTAHDAKIGY